ncbi:hypothetical protein [Mesorhizobium sp.]|uniref:hypothetical protein n=1 Tax=Mesorhizobium sp. TaxID=1871066 RepID=UPI000FE79CF9|nr:hypothetical protein [Mesorhizobium sp.]RWA97448.1 MAG: hypothetical protein EOQ33_31630 [Mesorhizobium sp.]
MAQADCPSGKEIWAGDSDGKNVVAYYPDGISSTSDIVFEGWEGKKIGWRVRATVECSNGIVICGLSIPTVDGRFIEAADAEEVGSGEKRFLVFASLQQTTAREQMFGIEIAAQWFGKKPTDAPAIVLPSQFGLVGCQKGDEMEAGTK